MGQFVNMTAYRFVDLPDRDELRQPMLNKCLELNLKGTILLAPEGINIFIAGELKSCDAFFDYLSEDSRFQSFDIKSSFSEHQPFTRMLVRLKKEIITLRNDEVKPSEFTGPAIKPAMLKQWFDEEKSFIVLDTRNDYETKFGKFSNAIDLNLQTFTDFPQAIQELPEKMKDQPVVMYCTGGVRCEKASVVMLNHGFKEVYQLDGGILKYFEEVGGDHWDGDCFVFDHRVCLNPDLEETDAALCFACREPLTAEEQASPLYVIGESCPNCA